MRQRLTVILTFVVIIGLLVAINTLTHVQEDESQDLEINPNRSTYHSGPTGTRALHDFLSESGYKVMRWREPAPQLLSESAQGVETFVVIGDIQVAFEQDDYALMLRWVEQGGRLVFIDRSPSEQLLSTAGWKLTVVHRDFPNLNTNPGDPREMTENVTALKPVQPTLLTDSVASVMPSRFGSRLAITAQPKPTPTPVPIAGSGVAVPIESSTPDLELPEAENVPQTSPEQDEWEAEPPPPEGLPPAELEEEDEYVLPVAPVVHIGDHEGALLVDYAHGQGRVILLTDPYLVTNGGISFNDNLRLALNVLGGTPEAGLIAFDEYHQGRGVTRNAFATYFAGTPVLAIAGQIVLLVLVVLWTNGRRFGRPVPLPQVDRRSSLEFVASMAELQERSRAFDLAIENIYSRTRRVLARHAGVDYNSSRSEIAERIASRSNIDRHELETVMRQCEEAINGEPINSRRAMHLVRRLREIERDLGLRMRSRDVRQAAENI